MAITLIKDFRFSADIRVTITVSRCDKAKQPNYAQTGLRYTTTITFRGRDGEMATRKYKSDTFARIGNYVRWCYEDYRRDSPQYAEACDRHLAFVRLFRQKALRIGIAHVCRREGMYDPQDPDGRRHLQPIALIDKYQGSDAAEERAFAAVFADKMPPKALALITDTLDA